MISKIIFVTTMLILSTRILAVPVAPDNFIDKILPDGTILRFKVCGDEYCNWLESQDGYMVLESPTGGYCYAIAENNELVPSNIYIGDPSHVNLIDKSKIKNILSKNLRIAINRQDSIFRLVDETYEAQVSTQVKSNFSFAKGDQKVLCILIEFPDRSFNFSASDYEALWNSISYTSNGNHGSVNQYYRENSCNQLNVTATVVGPYIASHSWSYYRTGLTNGLPSTYDKSEELIKEAIQAARADVRFKDFDKNNNFAVDVVHVIFAGVGMENDATNGTMWSHRGRISTAVLQAGIRANDYFCTPEYYNSSTPYPTIGTICHEYGHFIGAPDYYDVANNIFPGTGKWDVMCNSHVNRGKCPPHHNPYTKCYIYKWCTPSIITSTTNDYTLIPSNINNSFYRINTSTNGEFFLLENKAQTAFNSYVPTSGGNLLVYHIHKDIEDSILFNRVNTSHPQRCYVVSSNAISNPQSSPQSYCRNGIITSYPGIRSKSDSANIFFSANSIPSATSWNGTPTGVDLCFIRKSGNNIYFSVNPIITGPSVIHDQETYTLPSLPYPATVKWTYSTANISPIRSGFSPIIFVDGNTSQSVKIKRNFILMNTINPFDSIPEISVMTVTGGSKRVYYTGTIFLTATITCGGQSYSITKTIQLGNSSMISTPQKVEDIGSDINDESVNFKFYTLKTSQLLGSNHLQVNLIEQDNLIEHSYEGVYVLELWSLTTQGRVRHIHISNSQNIIDVMGLTKGLYQLVAYIDGHIVSSQKIFIQ